MHNYKQKLAIAGLALTVGLTGCNQNPTKEDTGQVVGAVIGGVLGSRIGRGSGKTAATIGGTLLGAYIGGQIGRQMDAEDRRQASNALENNRNNQAATWRNPDTGTRYEVTPKRTYYREETPCREYSTRAWIDGKEEVVYGTACRQADGSWQASN